MSALCISIFFCFSLKKILLTTSNILLLCFCIFQRGVRTHMDSIATGAYALMVESMINLTLSYDAFIMGT